jgi:ABC-2 type transport system ATP-binding protein
MVDAPVLMCHGLRRQFGDLVAVDDISFQIAAGETYGLLGPNGAGKTTTISMIAGLLERDAGEIFVAGQPMTTRTVKAKSALGYVPQDLAIYPDLSGLENLIFFARLYGMPTAAAKARADEVLELIGLTDRASEQTKTYSGGMKRRLNIGLGLLNRPKLLVLDEPTVGVDPQSRNAILESVAGFSGLAWPSCTRRTTWRKPRGSVIGWGSSTTATLSPKEPSASSSRWWVSSTGLP